MLLTWFNFSLSYWPGSKNVKLDALSRHYNLTAPTPEPETILPTSCLATALSWGIGKQVREAQRSEPNPGNRMFVSDAVCSAVLAHSSIFPATRAPSGPWPSCDNALFGLPWSGRCHLCRRLHGLCTEQVPSTSSGWPLPTSACPSSPLVSHLPGLCHGSPPI